jgi:hypothetical protein
MDKRDKFIADLRDEARKKRIAVPRLEVAGQGRSHDGVYW